MIHVIAVVTEPGRRAELIEEFQLNIPLQRAEPGCIGLSCARGIDDTRNRLGDNVFVMVET